MDNIRPLVLTAAALLHVLVGPFQAEGAKFDLAVPATVSFEDRESGAPDGPRDSSDDPYYRRDQTGPPLQLID